MGCKRPSIIKNKYISTFIGSFTVYLGIGFILPINNFAVYITSYIHLNQEFVTMHYGMFLNLIFMFAMSSSSSLGGILENRIGFYGTTMLGMAIVFVGNIFFFNQQNIWLCYFIALIMGIGTGISTSLIGKNLTLFRPNSKGIINGIIGLITILCSAIFAVAGEKIIVFNGYTLKEDEEYYPEEIAKRTYLYYLLGLIFLPIGALLTLLFIYEYKKEYDQNINNSENELKKEEEKKEDTNDINQEEKGNNLLEDESGKVNKETIKKHIKQVIKKIRFWRISSISFLINFSLSFMVNTGRTFGAIIGIDGSALQFLMVFQAIALIIIGPVLGILVDKKGPLFILRIVSIVSIIPGILLTFFMDVTFVFILSFLIDILGTVATMVSQGPFIMEVYGIQESVILGGIINAFTKISDIITTVTAFGVSFIYTKEELKFPYRILYITSSICCILSVFLLFMESNEKFKYEDSPLEQNLTVINKKLIQKNNFLEYIIINY